MSPRMSAGGEWCFNNRISLNFLGRNRKFRFSPRARKLFHASRRLRAGN